MRFASAQKPMPASVLQAASSVIRTKRVHDLILRGKRALHGYRAGLAEALEARVHGRFCSPTTHRQQTSSREQGKPGV